MRVLVIEDDATLGHALQEFLGGQGYAVDWLQSGDRVEGALAGQIYDLLLLDLNLPDGEGLQLLPALADSVPGQEAPPTVIVVTARDQVSDRIRGLDAGADDYLVKPYDPEELLARLRAVERRRGAQTSSVVARGDVAIDLPREVVRKGGQPVVLTPKEWALLRVLASRPEQTFTRDRLLEALYQWDAATDSNTLEVFISRLRRKLGAELIQTVRGTGYRLVAA